MCRRMACPFAPLAGNTIQLRLEHKDRRKVSSLPIHSPTLRRGREVGNGNVRELGRDRELGCWVVGALR